MRRILRLAVFAVCATFGATTAQADEVSAICNGSVAYANDARLCPVRLSLPFQSAGPTTSYAVRLTNPATACSDVSYVLYSNRPLFRRDAETGVAYSYRLRPGQAQTLAIGRGYAVGPQEVSLAAILFQGQCPGRAASSWRAFVTVAPDSRS